MIFVDLSADITAILTNHTARFFSESPLIGCSNYADLSSSYPLSVRDLPQGGRDCNGSHPTDDEHDEDEVAEGLREGEEE